MKRVAIIALAFVVLAVGSFAGYGWLTRRGEPAFSKGGAFGTPSVSSSPTPTAKADARRARTRAERRRAAAATAATATPKTGPTAQAVVSVSRPAQGTYTYDASGEERVRFGGTSACSWDVNTVTVQVRKDGKDHVFDKTYSDEHQQRMIERYSDSGVKLRYLGVAITCLGVRETTEDNYDPQATVLAFPLEVGGRWRGVSRTENRTEELAGKIVKRERITVPAGRFLTYKIETAVKLSDGQSGEAKMTNWFAPALGLSVKEIGHTEAQEGDARFTSDYTMELASRPS